VQHIVVDEYGALLEKWGQREREILGENQVVHCISQWTEQESNPVLRGKRQATF
jgi:hypothetical protein